MQYEINMKKNILTILLDSVFVIAFNICFFVNSGFYHSYSYWICYALVHFSYLMVLLASAIEEKGKTSYFSKLTASFVSIVYFLLELILAIVFFSTKTDNPKLIISIQTILTAIYLIVFISNIFANSNIAKKQSSFDVQNNFIKIISLKAKSLESVASGKSLKNKLNNLYYLIHSSPIKTCDEVSTYENKIQKLLEDLENLVTKNEANASDKIIEIVEMLNKRNNTLKTKA